MTRAELGFLATHPDALRALADYHSMQETYADAAGISESAAYHESKRLRYIELATQQQARIDDGYPLLPDTDGVGVLQE